MPDYGPAEPTALRTLWILIVVLAIAGVVVVATRQDDERGSDVPTGAPPLEKRNQLLAKIAMLEAQGAGEIAVGLEDFFEGNTDLGSIAPNLGSEQPPITVFFETLRRVRDRDDVQDVIVRISDYEDLDWPFSDTVWVLTSATASMVKTWVQALLPDEVESGWISDPPANAPELESGMAPVWVWWD